MKARFGIGLFACLCALLGQSIAHASPEQCQPIMTDGLKVKYQVCSFEKGHDIRLFWGESGQPYSDFASLKKALANQDLDLIFAMNAGMYHADRSPVGLYREAGKTSSKLQTGASYGNFGMVPNGVFFIHKGEFGVVDTQAYLLKSVVPDYASQSGPMLVIDGKLHPKFRKKSTSKRIRNGVGISEDGEMVYFVKSEVPVNFHEFATVFKDTLKSPNALYFDGVISRLYDAETGRSDIGVPMGPIVGVVRPRS